MKAPVAPQLACHHGTDHRNLRTWKTTDESLASERLQTTFVRDFSSGKAWYLGLYQDKLSASGR